MATSTASASTASHTHSTVGTTTRGHATFWNRVLAGVLGGIGGGLIFGALMAMMGMLPMIASMVGSDSAGVGFLIHMMMSIVIGLGLTVLFGNLLLTSYPKGALFGIGYGVIWWVLGPLMVMPMMFGMPLFSFDATTLPSLMGHMIYGAILGTVAVKVMKRHTTQA